MEIEIDSKRNNPLLNRTEVHFTVKHTGEKTPNRELLRSELADKLNAKKENIIISFLKSSFGINETIGYAKVYSSIKQSTNIENNYILKRNKLMEGDKKKKTKGEEKPSEKPSETEINKETPELKTEVPVEKPAKTPESTEKPPAEPQVEKPTTPEPDKQENIPSDKKTLEEIPKTSTDDQPKKIDDKPEEKPNEEPSKEETKTEEKTSKEKKEQT